MNNKNTNKENYQTPQVINFSEDIINSGIGGALHGAALMIGRSLAKSMKGGIDLVAGSDKPNTLQNRN